MKILVIVVMKILLLLLLKKNSCSDCKNKFSLKIFNKFYLIIHIDIFF